CRTRCRACPAPSRVASGTSPAAAPASKNSRPNRCWPRPIRRLLRHRASPYLDRRPPPASMSGVMSPSPNLGPKPHLGYTQSLIDRAAERRLDAAWLAACLQEARTQTYVIGGEA